ncbi:FAD-binding oxidoreductase [Methylopila sp. Yamaguchi]|uniref:FAD-binding oxidoreductase n=1 Tax=Methylopila sp. Yamaguchi TaxID=1437817 RepID=UPI000CC028CB|nr:FAD-binding oxidoreductase [Methylopila sp. Yamaguchi]GBD48763.1 oxidoreductase FAD-binding domain-containing protein [Methylopila sp. Yamaguchi]
MSLADAPRISGWRSATIVEAAPLTPRVKRVVLGLDPPLRFRAGQHVDLRLTAPDGYQARRSYSIASGPETPDRLELAIEKLDDGEVSPFFHEVAEVGDAIDLRGPIGGHFVWSVEDGGPLLLIGAGSGVAPLMSMVRHRAARGDRTPAALLLGARTAAEAPYREELLALAAADPSLGILFLLSRESAHGPFDRAGRVDAASVRAATAGWPGPARHVFVCGSNAFVNAAAEAALSGGAPPGSVRTERYGG